METASRARLLLVDDDPRFVRILANVLEQSLDDTLIEPCDSSDVAFQRIGSTDYDVVVTDLMMGGHTGLELLERVKQKTPGALVILITGADDRELSVQALRAGAYDFIQKPVDAEYLVASVRRAIETRRLRVEVDRQQAALRHHADELERAVAERTEELRQASHAKDEFLATISHELRTPLTAILGWARLLSGRRLDEPVKEQAIESIARNARSQAQLIDDLLDVSRIITGKLRLDLHDVDLRSVLEAALGVVLPAAQAKGITLQSIVAPDLGVVAGDPGRLQQVLWNLLANAIKFTPNGGHVAVHLRELPTHVEIEVVDDGAGIDADFLPFVFDRFRQADRQVVSRRGLGLGLAIVRHLVELHGGSVSAASEGRGRGARLVVTLPHAPRDVVPPRPGFTSMNRLPTGPVSQCLRGVRVLVVDDESDTRDVFRIALEQAGASVMTASSAREALSAYRRRRPNVVLCDIEIGEDDGYSLLQKLRGLPHEGTPVPAIALTGYAKSDDRSRALASGFQLHIAKPGPADLAMVIAGLLDR